MINFNIYTKKCINTNVQYTYMQTIQNVYAVFAKLGLTPIIPRLQNTLFLISM